MDQHFALFANQKQNANPRGAHGKNKKMSRNNLKLNLFKTTQHP